MRLDGDWLDVQTIGSRQYFCGYCDSQVGSSQGLIFRVRGNTNATPDIAVHFCPFCNQPTYFRRDEQIPGIAFGNSVQHLPVDVKSLYDETRQCTSAGAHTAAVLACRKILMHIAVDQKAKPGLNFLDYVEYLANNGFVPPNGKGWVDHIRKKGNEANHEIVLMTQDDAKDLVSFVEMLLKFIYEFPNRVPKPDAQATTRS